MENNKIIKKNRSMKAFLKEYGSAYLMMAPNFILFCAFVLYPLLWSLRFMFYEYDGVSQAIFTGFDNFVRAFTRDPVWWMSVKNTFVFAFGKLIIEIPLALILANILNTNIRGKSLLRGIYFLPNVTSAAVMSMVFYFMFSPYNGAVNNVLMNLNIIDSNISWLEDPKLAMVSCIIVSVWQNFGQNMLLFLAGLQNVPAELYESAKIDGASKFKSFIHITIPMLAPILQIVLMLAIIGSLNTFDTVKVLTNGGPNDQTMVMSMSVYNQFFAGDKVPDYGYGATLGFLSSTVIGVITIFYMYLSKKMKKIFD